MTTQASETAQMQRIKNTFERAKQEQRACFVAYICAGDPTPEASKVVCRTLLEHGVDLLEIGVPFSDPLADGQTNQLAAQRALEAGTTGESVLELVSYLRQHSDAPIIFYTYYNLMLAQGIETYCRRAKEAGVDGILALDCPPEEAQELLDSSRRAGLKNIFIMAPTTPPERMALIARDASGFIYYVSREGVTGVRDHLAADMESKVSEIRRHTNLPISVGFGISSGEQVKAVAQIADGVVVGSALVNVVAQYQHDTEQLAAALKAKMAELLGENKSNLSKM